MGFNVTSVIFFCLTLVLSHAAFDESLFPEEALKNIKAAHDKCVEETRASEDMIKDVNAGKFADDKSLKCYLKCSSIALGAITPEGSLDFDNIAKKMPPTLVEPLIHMMKECDKFDGEEDLCERTYKIHKCAYTVDPKNYFSI